MTEDQRQDLIDLTWRYAVLIGITNFEDIVAMNVLLSDRERWGHLIKTDDGLPVFDDDEAVQFMHELSGMPEQDCWEVLLEEWKR